MKANDPSLSGVSCSVERDRDFLAEQAYLLLAAEKGIAAIPPGARDNLLLERCAAHLMTVTNCSQRTAETEAAKAMAEMAGRFSPVSFDRDRCTTHALFLVERATGRTRVISSAEVARLLNAQETAALTE